MEKKTTGAWLIHHTNKLQQVTNATHFDGIALAGKAGKLLSAFAASNESTILSKDAVEAIAKSQQVSPKLELPTILLNLEQNRLISRGSTGQIEILGLTTTNVLTHTSDLFEKSEPRKEELAAIELAEKASSSPVEGKAIIEYLGDTYKLASDSVKEVLSLSEEIGFVDAEKVEEKSTLYFNGNLFRRDYAKKATAVLSSLNSADGGKIRELDSMLEKDACVTLDQCLKIIGQDLMKKLNSIGMYDLNRVCNDTESIAYVTKPAAFGKYGSTLEDDAFDLAKAFVSSLTYGMTRSSAGRGRISMLSRLMQKLVDGAWVGPATAIGQDYKILESRRVVQTRHETGGMFSMKLLKKEVGELALKAIVDKDASESTLIQFSSATLSEYHGPEINRESIRKKQSVQSKREAVDLLRTLRGVK